MKTYEKPELLELGTVSDLTEGGATGTTDNTILASA
jgi:hypothetical protein